MSCPTSWSPPPGALALSESEIHVWCAHLEVSQNELAQFQNTLAQAELARAARFHFPTDRRRFVAAHGVLRETLARYLHQGPASLQFSTGPCGKPTLNHLTETHGLRFNLSHSGEVALIAVARCREIGVDIERIRMDFDWTEIAGTSFSPRELGILRSLPLRSQCEAFFDYWARKEAYVKAMGKGLSVRLDQIDVVLHSRERAALRPPEEGGEGRFPWTIEKLDPVAGYAAALAAEGNEWRLKCWQRRPS